MTHVHVYHPLAGHKCTSNEIKSSDRWRKILVILKRNSQIISVFTHLEVVGRASEKQLPMVEIELDIFIFTDRR